MGSTFLPLILTNIGSRRCQIHGYPGVSVLDAAGVQIGSPAAWGPRSSVTVTLAPGGSAAAVLHTNNGTTTGVTCRPPATYMRIYPPDEYDAIVIPSTYQVCGLFEVASFVAGTGT